MYLETSLQFPATYGLPFVIRNTEGEADVGSNITSRDGKSAEICLLKIHFNQINTVSDCMEV